MNLRFQFVIFVLFLIINSLLFNFSVDKTRVDVVSLPGEVIETVEVIEKATFWNASDGQRYWGTAKNLANLGEFTTPIHGTKKRDAVSMPLTRAGPLPAIVFSLPIKMVGFDNSAIFIVAFQCFLLFLTGLAVRSLAIPFSANPNILQALVVFNPNLIGLAHHAQSDLLFTVIFTGILIVISKVVTDPRKCNLKQFLVLGLFVGMLPLARPIGLPIILSLPFVFGITLLLRSLSCRIPVRKLIVYTIVATTLSTSVLVPWALRNYYVLDNFGLSQSQAIMLRDQYKFLQKFGIPAVNPDTGNKVTPGELVQAYLDKNDYESRCSEPGYHSAAECKTILSKVYVSAIITSSPISIAKALSASWIGIFASGGIGNITKYVGISGQEASDIIFRSDKRNLKTLGDFLANTKSEHIFYFWLLVIVLAINMGLRILAVIGLVIAGKRIETLPISFFYVALTVVFLGLYLFVGLSRYRAPLEPILMLFPTIALTQLLRRVGSNLKD